MKCDYCRKEVEYTSKTSLESGQKINVCPKCYEEIRNDQCPPWNIEIVGKENSDDVR